MKNTIYISGQITGIETEASALFEKGFQELLERGFENIISPMSLKHDHDKSWINYMKTDIKALMDCDAIYMLNNWTNSKGAEIERRIAIDLGMKVIYQK